MACTITTNDNTCSIEQPMELEIESQPPILGDEDYYDDDGGGVAEHNEGDDDEDDDADDSDSSGEYNFQFQGGMDPLSFAEEGNNDVDDDALQTYQRFEQIQLDYEALAARKRPALNQCSTSGTTARRLRQEEEEEEEDPGATFERLAESMNYGRNRRRLKKVRKATRNKRRRRKGTKNKANPEVSRKIGDATCLYAFGRIDEAISLFKEVICLAPNLSDPYHMLGLIYSDKEEKKKALNFYMIAAHLSPKDASLWKLLITRSIEQGDMRQANYCLNKAIVAEPEDIGLRLHRASLYVELREYQKAAESYEHIFRLSPDNIEVLLKATQLYKTCGQRERAVCMLEDYLKNNVNNDYLSVVDLLLSLLMESNEYVKALEHIDHTQQVYCSGKEIPLHLIVKAGICHVHLGHVEKAEAYFNVLQPENSSMHPDLVMDVANSLKTVGQYESSLKYYMMLEEDADKYNGNLHLEIGRCYVALRKGAQAIGYYYKAVQKLDDSVEARLMLSSLLLEEDNDDEAISVLSPPLQSESGLDPKADKSKLWWLSGKIKLKLAQIYKAKGLFEAFADVLFPVIRETLFLETCQRKVKARKRLSTSVLSERVKVLDDHQTKDNLFRGFSHVASSANLCKAFRARKLLQNKNALKEAKRAAAAAAGVDLYSDDSDDESPQVFREPPLPDFLKEEDNHLLILDLCQSLSLPSSQRYLDALEIINFSLKLACSKLSVQMKEKLYTLGAKIPACGWECVRNCVSQRPHSFAAWNFYYKGILRNNRISKHKFLHTMRVKHKESIPPMLISAHRFTMISQHQAAAREYLEAHKLMPDNPLINLCVGTSLINLALGHRLQNKHQTVLQGLSFLYNNSRICEDSQESLYNIARAYQHVGLVSLAAKYYEKVLAIREKDYPIPMLPYENPDLMDRRRPGYCDLRREAAYNLHLIYKKSGAFDLARQVLKDHVVL